MTLSDLTESRGLSATADLLVSRHADKQLQIRPT